MFLKVKSPAKKKKKAGSTYQVDKTVAEDIRQDKNNSKLWEEALEVTSEGAQVSIHRQRESL